MKRPSPGDLEYIALAEVGIRKVDRARREDLWWLRGFSLLAWCCLLAACCFGAVV